MRLGDLRDAVDNLRAVTEGWPWYWLSYGEKCYVFAVVEAHPADDDAPWPRPGSQLRVHQPEDRLFSGENGTPMIVEQQIATIEQQSGDAICRFIAEAHAALFKPDTN